MNSRLAILLGALALLPSSGLAKNEEGKITEGRLEAVGPDGKALGPCPLKHTKVNAELSGTVARVAVTQQFHNPFKDKIEAVYVFPLHQDSAVDDMTMTVGERVVKGVIKERGEARRIYETAKAQGKVASLLDQERPNIFTQSVANIEPGEQVTITIKYSQTLNWEEGRFGFDFPIVVGPRYIPGGSPGPDRDDEKLVGDAARGDVPPSLFRDPNPERGQQGEPPVVNKEPTPPTDQVPDADRITPPVVEEGFRAGHDISIMVRIEAGREIVDLKSLQHEVQVEHPDGDKTRARVTLVKKTAIPNRDFEISFRTAGEAITDSILTHTDERGKFFTMVLQPPIRVEQEEIVPRELVFVLDTSGSMRGFPIETSKAMMRRAIENLRPRDRFNIVTFAGNTSVLFPAPVDNTEENRARGLRFLDTLQGAGGTEMMKAINTALGGEHGPKKDFGELSRAVRIVCFLTDGYVGNDLAIVGAVKEHARTTRVFSFGIGTSPNRFLLDKMASAGRGEAQYVLHHQQAPGASDKFYQRIDAPVLTDIELDFGGLEVEEVYPKRIEDLFAAKPVVVKGRYKKAGEGTIKLKGTNAAGAFEREIEVSFPEDNPANEVLASQWARSKVADLMMEDMKAVQQGQTDPALKETIVGLGVTYNLLTQFTSFVAVEELRITEGGKPRTMRVPVEMPQGVSYSGVFGRGMAISGAGGYATFGYLGRASTAYRQTSGGGGPAPAVIGGNLALDEADAEDLALIAGQSLAVLEQKHKEGKLTAEEKREQLLPLKLEKSLLELAAAGGDQPLEVQVTLRDTSDQAIAKLKELGFVVLARAATVKLVIGKIPANKLEALALLEVVRRVEPVES